MSVDLYAAKVVSEVHAERQALEMTYRDFPDANLYFMMVDLVQSTNYRLRHGPERGCIRGESFFSLVQAVVRPYAEIRIFKEMGDAVLACCPSLRPLLESAVLMEYACRQLTFSSDDPEIPFSVRTGIDFGVAKRLSRRAEDYLGVAIDRLSRIMTVRSDTSRFLISEDVYTINSMEIDQYKPLLSVSTPLKLELSASKSVSTPIIYREISFPRRDSPYTDYFVAWRHSTLQPIN